MEESRNKSILEFICLCHLHFNWKFGNIDSVSRNKAHNPWTVQVRRDLPVQIFAFLLHMVKKARSTYSVTHSESRSLDIIVYTEENRVVRDLSRLCVVNQEAINPGTLFKDISWSQQRKCKGGCQCPKAIYLVLL